MISNEILKKYNMLSLDEYKTMFGDNLDTERTFYQTLLIQTDHIPNKIIEKLIEDLADASLINFLEVFINFISTVRGEYKEILQFRKFAREEINRLESNN